MTFKDCRADLLLYRSSEASPQGNGKPRDGEKLVMVALGNGMGRVDGFITTGCSLTWKIQKI